MLRQPKRSQFKLLALDARHKTERQRPPARLPASQSQEGERQLRATRRRKKPVDNAKIPLDTASYKLYYVNQKIAFPPLFTQVPAVSAPANPPSKNRRPGANNCTETRQKKDLTRFQ